MTTPAENDAEEWRAARDNPLPQHRQGCPSGCRCWDCIEQEVPYGDR